MYEQNYGGVDLRKKVYALKCPVCGAECKNKQDGECPYCGAYLEFADDNGSSRVNIEKAPEPPQYVPPMQPSPMPYRQYIDPATAEAAVSKWRKKQRILIPVYVAVTVVTMLGVVLFRNNDVVFDRFMYAFILLYMPMSAILPIYLTVTRPDELMPPPKPASKIKSWLLYSLTELILFIALFIINTVIDMNITPGAYS